MLGLFPSRHLEAPGGWDAFFSLGSSGEKIPTSGVIGALGAGDRLPAGHF